MKASRSAIAAQGRGSVKVEIQPPSITLRVNAHVTRAAEASAADVFAKAMGE
ncbi:hypothetical protein [Microbispora bryophytorum]|uniref:hypothetical protein n=1 Tax=Microbispora bryophytorum TaxID=1460882 RepID=UPI0033F12FCD